MPDSSEAGVHLQLLFDEPPGLFADFLGSPRPRHAVDDGVDGVPLGKKGQDPPQGRFRQFEL